MSFGGSSQSAFFPGKAVVTGPAKNFTYTVTAGPATTPISLDELKSYLRIPPSVTADDALLLLIIDLTVLTAEKIIRRDLITKTYSTFRDSIVFQADQLILRRSKLIVVNSIDYINNDDIPTNVPSTVWDNTLQADYSRVYLKLNQSWPTDAQDIPQSVTVSFDAGYGPNATDVPADIRGALLQHAANFYENRGDCACDGAGADLALPAQSKKIYDLYKIKSIITMENFL